LSYVWPFSNTTFVSSFQRKRKKSRSKMLKMLKMLKMQERISLKKRSEILKTIYPRATFPNNNYTLTNHNKMAMSN